jgi:hypothetical protein
MDDKGLEKYKPSGYPTVIFLDPDGKEIAKLGDRSPAAVAKQIDEIAEKFSRGPKWVADIAAALAAGKSESKPVALVFVDEKPKSTQFLQLLSDPSLAGDLDKAVFAKLDLKKDAEEAKKWKVSAAGTIVIVDASGDEPKAIKTLSGSGPKAIKSALEEAIKKLSPK